VVTAKKVEPVVVEEEKPKPVTLPKVEKISAKPKTISLK